MFEKFIYWLFKAYYKNFTKEDQRYLYLQNRHWYKVEVICWLAIAIIICILEEIIVIICNNLIVAIAIALLGGILVFILTKKYVYKMAQKMYPIVITRRGKSISKEDFKAIKRNSSSLYDTIMSDKCCGKCYYISWAILYVLRKGYIQFVAVRDFYEIDEEKRERYKIHVLYVNDGWCFDTYSQRQMLVEELCKIWRGKLIDSYDYSAIEGKSFEEFRDSIAPKLREWCDENDCRYFVNR